MQVGMDSLCNDLHKEYQEYYNKFVNINQEFDDYNQSAIRCNYSSNICNLWLFKSKISSDQNFIITPSLFNSPKILIFNKEQNYIEYMQSFGNVYLLEWRETKDTLKL